MSRHVQSEESYASIPDAELRESVKQAIARAGELDWPLFIALSRGTLNVDCFDAAIPTWLSEFLSGCARYAFGSFQSEGVLKAGDIEVGEADFEEVRDKALRAAVERIHRGAVAGGLIYSLHLWPVPKVHTGQFLYFRLRILRPAVAAHLDSCFVVGIFAKLKTSDVEPKLN